MMLTTPFPICMDSSSGKDPWTSSSQMLLQAQRAGFDLQMEGQSRESMLNAMSSACLQQEQSHHHERRIMKPQPPPSDEALKCPRCESMNTKFCYYNNYSLSQPRYFCKTCRRYWTKGGTLRTVPVGGGCRKSKKQKKTHPQSPSSTTTNNLPQQDHQVSLPFPFNSSMLSQQMMSFEGHGVPQITSVPDTGMLTPYSKVNEFLMASIKPNKINNGSGSSALDLQLLLSPFAGLPPLNSTKTAPSSFASLLDFPKMEEESLHLNSHTNLFGENNGYWSSSNNTIPSSSSTVAPSSH